MLAILYLAWITYFGDRLCRRFFRYHSIHHRLACAFIVGLTVSSFIVYLGALAFASTSHPLFGGNFIFILISAATLLLPEGTKTPLQKAPAARPPGNSTWDWTTLAVCTIFATVLMFLTLNYRNGVFEICFIGWTDFGANLSLAQSFVDGRNFPTEHPFFPGEFIRYHFLFWFQAANLSYLGMNLVWAVNLLSIISLVSLSALLMTLAEIVFSSRFVGRLSALLFFFASSSLSYIPFLLTKSSIRNAVGSTLRQTTFLESGYPYRGENWGALSVDVFANQRHLIAATAILFVVIVFLADLYRFKLSKEEPDHRQNLPALFFCGALIGALPYWNSAILASALVLLGGAFIFLRYRLSTAIVIATAVVIAMPQVLQLRSGNLGQTGQTLFQWGYTIPDPTAWLVIEYIAWTFGFKWILIFIALWYLPKQQRLLFAAATMLLVIAFTLRLSSDAFNNHKLLNVWGIFATMFAAYGVWRFGRASFPRAALAGFLLFVTILGAIIDLFPVRNDPMLVAPYENDRLTRWVYENTKPTDVFLTQNLLTHPILFAGRKIFLGHQLYAFTAGYDVEPRQEKFKQMFTERDPQRLKALLHENNISFVGIDDGVRSNPLVKDNLNDDIYKQHFEVVYDDYDKKQAHITIYRVPAE